MARLSLKKPNDLIELPQGYQNQKDLVALLLSNPVVVKTWQGQYGSTLPDDAAGFVKIFFMKNSWQLSFVGVMAFAQIFTYWSVQHPDNVALTGRVLVNMSKITNGPWYSQGRHICVWSQNTHFELLMFDGSIKRFVEFYMVK
jgi:hypothetical protein